MAPANVGEMSLRTFLATVVTAALGFTALAAEESLLPAFGPAGAEFTVNAKDGNKATGWLPKDWVDNTEWAAVSATYSKLNDPPKEGVTAVRIKVEKVDEGQRDDHDRAPCATAVSRLSTTRPL